MKKIKEVEIEESKSLQENLDKLRLELLNRYNFWVRFRNGIQELRKKQGKKIGVIGRFFYFLGVFPTFLRYQFNKTKYKEWIKEGEEELISYYESPSTKVRHFRFQCEKEERKYSEDLEKIDTELERLKKNYKLDQIGEKMKSELKDMIREYEQKRSKKEKKYNFYKSSSKKLFGIEEQLRVKLLLEESRVKLAELKENYREEYKRLEVKKEIELYQYYGEVLDELSSNLKKVKEDEKEEIEELELQTMLNQIKLRR